MNYGHMQTQRTIPARRAAMRGPARAWGARLAALAAFIGLAGSPSLSMADTPVSLGQAAQYSLFEVSGSAGLLTLSNSPIVGNVGLGSGTSKVVSNSPITGTITYPVNAQANTDAINASVLAGGLAATGSISGNKINGATTFNAQAGQNVLNLTSITLSNATFTISGSAASIVIINVSGAITLTNSTIALSGVTADHVLFNVTGTGKAVTLSNSQVKGTFLDLGGSITVTNGSTTGAYISQKAITLTNHSLSGTPLSVPATVVHAPEMPTILTAGLAWILVLGKTRLDRRKLRRA